MCRNIDWVFTVLNRSNIRVYERFQKLPYTRGTGGVFDCYWTRRDGVAMATRSMQVTTTVAAACVTVRARKKRKDV